MQYLVGSAKGYYARLRRTGGDAQLPTADEAARELTTTEREQPTSIVDGQWPQFVAGNPSEVRAMLEQMIDESGADEVMIQNLIADPEDRRHSHALLAQTFGLVPRQTPVTGGADTFTVLDAELRQRLVDLIPDSDTASDDDAVSTVSSRHAALDVRRPT